MLQQTPGALGILITELVIGAGLAQVSRPSLCVAASCGSSFVFFAPETVVWDVQHPACLLGGRLYTALVRTGFLFADR